MLREKGWPKQIRQIYNNNVVQGSGTLGAAKMKIAMSLTLSSLYTLSNKK